MRATADTVNITEPMPPSPRNTTSCQYEPAKAVAPVEIATMTSPVR